MEGGNVNSPWNPSFKFQNPLTQGTAKRESRAFSQKICPVRNLPSSSMGLRLSSHSFAAATTRLCTIAFSKRNVFLDKRSFSGTCR